MEIENLRVKVTSPEAIGKRIARLRSERGWTQQALAARLAISRVAVSHIEMDLSLPSERTAILLAGLFKLSPHALVEGTTYPQAKAERLPAVVCCFTELEMEIALMQNDLTWLEACEERKGYFHQTAQLVEKWRSRLANFVEDDLDENERKLLSEARQQLASLQKGQ
jgi:transcriptional regulator with XRE-family HTH domain